MNRFEKLIAVFSPKAALKRFHARKVLAYYEASRTSTLQKQRRETGSADAALSTAGRNLREQARHLDQNHDIAKGILRVLVNNVVGPNGIGIEPQPLGLDGKIHADFARQVDTLYRRWSFRPEATKSMQWSTVQRMGARSWFRDGEFLAQILRGTVAGLDHSTKVPFSLEMLEADFLATSLDDKSKKIRNGVQRNSWNQPVAYLLYKEHPGDGGLLLSSRDTKTVSADRLLHVAIRDRLHQTRGVSIFASILGRLDDLKDYEESERIAAKVAASMAAFIKKGMPDMYSAPTDEDGDETARRLTFKPGMVFDDLKPGEEIGTIDTTRPSSALEPHRNGQLRAIAAGPGVPYSSISKNYQGSYSSQRQELVEGWVDYGVLSNEFIGQFVRPVYEQFVTMAVLSGQLVVPPDVDIASLTDALYVPPQMPWIDPDKESKGWERLEVNGHASGPEIIRKRGGDPARVREQEILWRRSWRDEGEAINTDPLNSKTESSEKDDNEETEKNKDEDLNEAQVG